MSWLSLGKSTVDKIYQPNCSNGWMHEETEWFIVKTQNDTKFEYRLFDEDANHVETKTCDTTLIKDDLTNEENNIINTLELVMESRVES